MDNEGAVAAPAPPAPLNLVPTQKATADLFARAPEVKRMSRKDRQRAAVAAAIEEKAPKKRLKGANVSRQEGGGSAAAPAAAEADSAAVAAAPSKRVRESGPFVTVFAEELDSSSKGDGGASLGNKRSPHDKGKGSKPHKRLLRHALHPNEEEDARTVFVGNLPNTVDKKKVAKAFKDCGAIESVRVRSQALEPTSGKAGAGSGAGVAGATGDGEDSARVVGTKDVGRAVRVLRGELKKDPRCSATAYILFKDSSSVTTAIQKKNGVVFQDRHLVVTALDAASAAYPPETSVFLGNVAYDTTEEDVWRFFSEHGIADVKRVRLVRDRDSGDCKGFGYVEFHSKKTVEPAIATRGALLNGRELRIVHTNLSKNVKAVTASRREKRARSSSADGSAPVGRRARKEEAPSKAKPSPSASSAAQPSWMGLTTNPRKKAPRDLRFLLQPKTADKKGKGPRPPVKRKMRNPEK